MDYELIMKNLEKNNFKPYLVKSKENIIPLLKTIISKGDTVSVGGSMTLFETGVIDFLRNGDYNFLDRYKEGLSHDEVGKIYRDSFFADAYLCGTNALLKSGALYNVDGNSNRVASIVFGPKSVIIIAGKNKIVNDFDEAVKRVKEIAAPKNAKRLSCETYCNIKEKCVSLNNGNADVCNGCASNSRICCNYVLSSYQKVKDRIKVIIVDEELGY